MVEYTGLKEGMGFPHKQRERADMRKKDKQESCFAISPAGFIQSLQNWQLIGQYYVALCFQMHDLLTQEGQCHVGFQLIYYKQVNELYWVWTVFVATVVAVF